MRGEKKSATPDAEGADGGRTVSITPETAFGYVEGVVRRYAGTPEAPATFDDFKVLDSSLAMLRGVVLEHARMKAALRKVAGDGNRKSRRAGAAKVAAKKRAPAKRIPTKKKKTASRKRTK